MYTGEKVRLREYRKEDAPLALAFINDEEIKRNLSTAIPLPTTLGDEEKWIEGLSTKKPEGYSFAIETLAEGKYIGGCGINQLDWNNSFATVGILIGDKDYHNKGYGTDAMKTLINFIFSQMSINKIKLYVFSFNERAIKCYEKCGFKREGVLRQEVFRDGKLHDNIAMGLLREEWISQQK